MSWKQKDLRQASFRSILFDFIDIRDGERKAIVKHEYPNQDGAQLEDMGLNARTVTMRAVFFGEKYDNLKAFKKVLKETGSGKVVHPLFGTFRAIPESVNITHDERAYYAEVDITFVEHTEVSASSVSTSARAAAKALSDEKATTLAHAANLAGKAFKNDGIPEGISTSGLGGDGYMTTISSYKNAVRSKMRNIDTIVGNVRGFINAFTSPFQLITSTVAFATDLPGSILSSFAGGIESVAGTYQNIVSAPGKFTASLNYGLQKIDSALGQFGSDSVGDSTAPVLKTTWSTVKATSLASAAAMELSIDETAEAGGQTNLAEFSESANAQRTELMTINDIDSVTATVREAINAAIADAITAYGEDAVDLINSLKAQAWQLQNMADLLRLKREKIVDYEVASATSLHLIAFQLYGDLGQADRLLRINRIKNPNNIEAGKVLKVYAE